MRIWSAAASRILVYYFRHIKIPYKYRLWNVLRTISAHPRLTVKYEASQLITLDARNRQERLILLTGRSHEPEVLDTVRGHLIQDEIVWDVGANIGSFAISLLSDTRVSEFHCFEPHPDVIEVLKHNLNLNRGRTAVHPVALGSKVGKGTLYAGLQLYEAVMSSMLPSGNGVSMEIDVWTGDYAVSQMSVPPPTIIKIDVEGAEYPALVGLKNTLMSSPPKLIVFETLCNEEWLLSDKDLSSLLTDVGYKVEPLRRYGSGHQHSYEPRSDGLYIENFVAFR